MNDLRRKEISALISKIEETMEQVENLKIEFETIKDEIEQVRDDEQEYFYNMPEAFKSGERGERAVEAIGNLDTALEDISSLVDALSCDLDNCISYLEEAKA